MCAWQWTWQGGDAKRRSERYLYIPICCVKEMSDLCRHGDKWTWKITFILCSRLLSGATPCHKAYLKWLVLHFRMLSGPKRIQGTVEQSRCVCKWEQASENESMCICMGFQYRQKQTRGRIKMCFRLLSNCHHWCLLPQLLSLHSSYASCIWRRRGECGKEACMDEKPKATELGHHDPSVGHELIFDESWYSWGSALAVMWKGNWHAIQSMHAKRSTKN